MIETIKRQKDQFKSSFPLSVKKRKLMLLTLQKSNKKNEKKNY
jgi:hypothetical protein